jgi:hypothetical protein
MTTAQHWLWVPFRQTDFILLHFWMGGVKYHFTIIENQIMENGNLPEKGFSRRYLKSDIENQRSH